MLEIYSDVVWCHNTSCDAVMLRLLSVCDPFQIWQIVQYLSWRGPQFFPSCHKLSSVWTPTWMVIELSLKIKLIYQLNLNHQMVSSYSCYWWRKTKWRGTLRKLAKYTAKFTEYLRNLQQIQEIYNRFKKFTTDSRNLQQI